MEFFKDLLGFMKERKQFWLLPVIIIFLLLGVLMFVNSAAAPFIYTLF